MRTDKRENSLKSPFDVPAVKSRAGTQDILDAVRESRSHAAESPEPHRRSKRATKR